MFSAATTTVFLCVFFSARANAAFGYDVVAPFPGCQCFLTASLGGVFSSPSRCVDSSKNSDCRSRVCSCGVATCWFLFGASRLRVNKDAVAAAARKRSPPFCNRFPQPVAFLSERPLNPPFPSLPFLCLQPVDGVQRTVLECLSLTHAVGLHSLYALCRR